MSNHLPVIIVGAGQSGLAMSYCLRQRGIEHLLLERNVIGSAWRSARWDSLCLVTPNWQCRLPGHPYRGDDPEGFMPAADVVRYIEAYAVAFDPPVRQHTPVSRVRRDPATLRFEISTPGERFSADQLVIATSGYHVAKVPALASALPAGTLQLNSATYRNPQQLPPGDVMVVGSGQSGCQIAEDLHLAGRRVHLCVGSTPRVARRYRGRDVVAWLEEMGHYDLPVDRHPEGEAVRRKSNHYVTGRDGGRDIDLRKFACEGMQLHGRLTGIDAAGFEFADDLEPNLDRADATYQRIANGIDAHIAREQIAAPPGERYVPVWRPAAVQRRLAHADANVRTVIWSMGFGMNFGWLELPVFDGNGYPLHARGVTPEPGLYFIGLPWLYTWGSARFSGVARDAEHIAAHIAERALR